MSVNGAANEAINDTNLLQGECTLRIHLNEATSVTSQNEFFYTFDGSTPTTEAVGIEAYGFEQGVTATAWTQINDDSAVIGGNNSGERIELSTQGAGTDLHWYLAVSARGESAGGKTSFDLGFAVEIF